MATSTVALMVGLKPADRPDGGHVYKAEMNCPLAIQDSKSKGMPNGRHIQLDFSDLPPTVSSIPGRSVTVQGDPSARFI